MADDFSLDARRRDDAVRAAWLYFIGGRTQDEIAKQLSLSRQAAQRLVAQAVSEQLVKFRIDHPLASCMELAARLADRFELEFCDVVPSDRSAPTSVAGIAIATAMRMQKVLSSRTPLIFCVGTGRTLRATVECLDSSDRPQHKILSLVGNMAADGHASPYEVTMRIADKLGAQRYPMSTPVLTETAEERTALQRQRSYVVAREMHGRAQASFVGISDIAWQSPLHADGFIDDKDISQLIESGAIGEIIGWSFDRKGEKLKSPVNDRVSSIELPIPPRHMTVVSGCGPSKAQPIHAALTGKWATALITDELTAATVLEIRSP